MDGETRRVCVCASGDDTRRKFKQIKKVLAFEGKIHSRKLVVQGFTYALLMMMSMLENSFIAASISC